MMIGAYIRKLAKRTRIFGDRLFHEQDVLARGQGWTIGNGRSGLSRTYRDPRFDRLRACPACGGRGKIPDRKRCRRCGGSGRIDLGANLAVRR